MSQAEASAVAEATAVGLAAAFGLVRDGTQQPVSAGALAERLTAWITSLADRSRSLAEAD